MPSDWGQKMTKGCECKKVYNEEMDDSLLTLHSYLFHKQLKQCQDCKLVLDLTFYGCHIRHNCDDTKGRKENSQIWRMRCLKVIKELGMKIPKGLFQ